MRRSFWAVLVACTLLLTACGGNGNGHAPRRLDAHACRPGNYFMQCALSRPTNKLTLRSAKATAYGEDFGWGGPSCGSLKAGSRNFGASYESYDFSKNWQVGQIRDYLAHGCSIILVWETTQTRALGGFSAGRSDAQQALAQAHHYGQPDNRPVFFGIDFDANASQQGAINAYFRGIHSIFDNLGPVSFPGPAKPVGAYGGYWPLKRLFDARLISYGWQTYAWSGGLWDSRSKLEQYLNDSSVDFDRAIAADFGQYPYHTTKPSQVCYSHRISSSECAAVKTRVAHLRTARHAYDWRLWWANDRLSRNHCRAPYRRHRCVRLGRLRSAMAFDVHWLDSQIHTAIATH